MRAAIGVRREPLDEVGASASKLVPHATHDVRHGACARCRVQSTWPAIETTCRVPAPRKKRNHWTGLNEQQRAELRAERLRGSR